MPSPPPPIRHPTTSDADPGRSSSIPDRPTFWWVEALAAAIVAIVYLAAPRAAPSVTLVTAAQRRGAALYEWEQSLGLAIEPAVQSRVAALQLEWLANWLYGSLHFVVTAVAFVALWCRRRAAYPQWRTSFVVASVGAFAVHHWLPVAPPRLVADGHGSTIMADWLAQHPTPWSFESGPISEVANHYAAMPSMHVGWAVLSAVALGPLCRGRWRTGVLVGYPLLVAVVVMATGNHFLVDAVAGVGVALGALLVVRATGQLWQRWRLRSGDRRDPGAADETRHRPDTAESTAADVPEELRAA